MNAIQTQTQVAVQSAANELDAAVPALLEELTIDELAVREEYSACYTVH